MWSTDDIKKMNANLLQVFQNARLLHPNDPELLVYNDLNL